MEPGAYGTYSKGYPEILARPPLPRKPRPNETPGPGANKRARRCITCPRLIMPTGKRGHPKLRCDECRSQRVASAVAGL